MKKSLFGFGLILAMALPVFAADQPNKAVPVVRLPMMPPPPVPPVQPQQVPDPVTKLSIDTMYVIEADVECFVKQFSPAVATVSCDEGPLRVRGQFADEPGKVQTRIYKSKYVYTLVASGTGRANLTIVPKGVDNADNVILLSLDVTDGVTPAPPGPPTPDQSKSPFSAEGFRVLVVYPNQPETKLPLAQQAILSGQTTRQFLETNCVAGPDGKTKEFRIWREDERLDSVPKLWKDAFGRKKESVPWVMIGNGKNGYEGPLPANEDDFIKLAQKYLTK